MAGAGGGRGEAVEGRVRGVRGAGRGGGGEGSVDGGDGAGWDVFACLVPESTTYHLPT